MPSNDFFDPNKPNKRDPEHPHLWIDSKEITTKIYAPTSRTKERPVQHAELGAKLMAGVQAVERSHSAKTSSLEDVVVFKMKLAEGEKFQNKERQKILKENRLKLNAVRNENTALVSIETKDLPILKSRLASFTERRIHPNLQFVESFEPLSREEKQSFDLRVIMSKAELPNELLDLQIQLVPHLDRTTYDKALKKLVDLIRRSSGKVPKSHYLLSDQTPVLRFFLPAEAVNFITDDEAVYRIETTTTFQFMNEEREGISIAHVPLHPEVDVTALPIVAVIDSGVEFSLPALIGLLVGEWAPPDLANRNPTHGTQVASRVIFGDALEAQVAEGYLVPRARVVSACIFDGQMTEDMLIQRIQGAIAAFKHLTRIFNLSINTQKPIEGDRLSILAQEIDALQAKHGVQFVISSGNHGVWRFCEDLDEVLDDDDSQIASPGEAVTALTVGAIVRAHVPGSLSVGGQVAPYSRKGPGFAGNRKVDLVAMGGNTVCDRINLQLDTPAEGAAHVLLPNGLLVPSCGTSFAAPVVAGDLAEVLARLPEPDLLLAKTLLLHTAAITYDDDGFEFEERERMARSYGNGWSNPTRALRSTESSVTFVTRGEMSRLEKQRVKFWMPSFLAALPGRNTARVHVTVVSNPPLDPTMGEEYLGAYVDASLHKRNGKGTNEGSNNPSGGEGRGEWQPYMHFTRNFSRFNPGDWEIWLQLWTRWDVTDTAKVPYGLAITVEDPTGKHPIYTEIRNEVPTRFRPLVAQRVRAQT